MLCREMKRAGIHAGPMIAGDGGHADAFDERYLLTRFMRKAASYSIRPYFAQESFSFDDIPRCNLHIAAHKRLGYMSTQKSIMLSAKRLMLIFSVNARALGHATDDAFSASLFTPLYHYHATKLITRDDE